MIEVVSGETVRIVRLARPGRRNALTPAGLDQLAAAVSEADEPVVVLEGTGEAFCAGADLDVVASLDTEEDARAFARHGQRVAAEIEAADAVTIAAIDGAARGGGLELALACDLRIGTPDATLGEPGVTLGLFGAWGGTVRLPAIVGLGDAMDISLSGRVLDAEEALRTGLLSRVVEDPRTVAAGIAANDPDAMRVLANRLRDRRPVETQEAAEAEAFGRLVIEHADALRSGE